MSTKYKIKLALGGALFAALVVVQPADADHRPETCDQMAVVLPLVSPLPLEDEIPTTAIVVGYGRVYTLPLVSFEVDYENNTAFVTYGGCF